MEEVVTVNSPRSTGAMMSTGTMNGKEKVADMEQIHNCNTGNDHVSKEGSSSSHPEDQGMISTNLGQERTDHQVLESTTQDAAKPSNADNFKTDNGHDEDDSDGDIEVLAVTPGPIQIAPHQQQQQIQQQQQQKIQQQTPHQQQQIQQRMQYHNQREHSFPPRQQPQEHQTVTYCGYKVKCNFIYRFPSDNQHIPTWRDVLPKHPPKTTAHMKRTNSDEIHAYKLSLLTSREFTINPVQHHTNSFYFEPTLNGLRRPIKEITRKHGNAGEKATLDDGKWKIPLSVYYAFYTYLSREPNTVVYPIPEAQLNIASMGRAAAARGYPSPQNLMDKYGVPRGLSTKLAPYQRGGVDFVMQRSGRALIADEMGLGKTVQGIASMTCYENEWPLLVLSPSSARYHWEAEFLQWLGEDSPINVEATALEKKEAENPIDLDQNGDAIEFDEEKKVNSSDRFDSNGDDVSFKRKRDNSTTTESRSRRRRKNIMKLMNRDEINVLGSSNEPILRSHDTRVVIISYGLIPNLVKKGLLFPGQFKCCIVDESHMLKNKNSKRTLSIMPLLQGATRVVMLSGTPAMAKPVELFPQLNALGAKNGWWDDEQEFISNYVKDKYSDPSFAELHALLTSTVMIRRMKNDILKELPAKVRESVHVNVRCQRLKEEIREGLLALREGKGVLGKLSVLYQTDLKKDHRDGTEDIQNDLGMNRGNIMYNTPINVNGDDKKNRKTALNRVFKLTGTAKIPVLVDMLKRWIKNPTNGKICIFAHHIDVLDGIMNGAELSNAPDSQSKFIRIDGSTLPRVRQDQITSFQNDPSVRIAILGITAAGVGVTLTAASTIWFAELFWTPAIMIQAEDRCHRIGQQAIVHCLYTIARGTLDEVLWILLKRKFRALGEFVEGKEMMDIVVHNSFNNEIEAVDRKSEINDDSDSEMENEDLANDQIQKDLEELAMEEQLATIGDDEDNLDDEVNMVTVSKKNDCGPQSEKNVICLLDDDEEEPASTSSPSVDISIDEVSRDYIHGERSVHEIDFALEPTTKMPGMFIYQAFFPGPSYGLGLDHAFGRIFIEHSRNEIYHRGDVLIAIDNWKMPPNFSFQRVVGHLRQLLQTPPVRLFFGRDKCLAAMYEHFAGQKRKAIEATGGEQLTHQQNEIHELAPPSNNEKIAASSSTQTAQKESDVVIELSDDDD